MCATSNACATLWALYLPIWQIDPIRHTRNGRSRHTSSKCHLWHSTPDTETASGAHVNERNRQNGAFLNAKKQATRGFPHAAKRMNPFDRKHTLSSHATLW